MSKSEVIIVECGPVGLITTLGLGRAGVHVTLVEAEARPSKAPRALVCTSAETIEQEMAQVRRLSSDQQAELDRTLFFVGELKTPSLVTGGRLNAVVARYELSQMQYPRRCKCFQRATGPSLEQLRLLIKTQGPSGFR